MAAMKLDRQSSNTGLMRPGSRIRFRRTSDVHAPWVAAPPGMVFLEVLLLGWLAVLLGVVLLDEALANQLFKFPVLMIGALVLGALIPLLVAYGIATNRIWSRSGAFAAVIGIVWVIGWYVNVPQQLKDSQFLVPLALAAVAAVAAWYLYGSRSVRNYFAILRGHLPPEALHIADSSQRDTPRSAAMGGPIQSFLEYALMVVGLALIAAALVQMSL